jgi:hypothetical protein
MLSGRGLCDEMTTRPEKLNERALAHWGAHKINMSTIKDNLPLFLSKHYSFN